MSIHKVVFAEQNRRPKVIFGVGLCAVIALAAIGAWGPFGYPWYRLYALGFIAVIAALLAYAIALIVPAQQREYWGQQEYELIDKRLTQRHFGWPDKTVDLRNLVSATERKGVIVLQDHAGGRVTMHRKISGLPEIEKHLSLPIKQRAASFTPVFVCGYLMMMIGVPLWFMHNRSRSGALVWLGIVILPMILSVAYLVRRSIQRNSENEKQRWFVSVPGLRSDPREGERAVLGEAEEMSVAADVE